jgi:glycosyltransferase involved in cell wall biosynthesis
MPDAPPLRLLCFGFVRDYKGFDIAVAALRRLHDRGVDARLTIAGEVWGDAAPWYQHARELGITLIPRYLTDAEVVDLVASHHLLVAPYRSATQSGPVSLAFGSGRPVVATSVGGLQEAVTDGVNGRLVPPGDVAALSDAIEEVSKDLEGYARGAGATRLTWSHVADALLAPVLR